MSPSAGRSSGRKRAILAEAFADSGMTIVGSTAGIYLWVAVPDDLALANRLLEENICAHSGTGFRTRR